MGKHVADCTDTMGLLRNLACYLLVRCVMPADERATLIDELEISPELYTYHVDRYKAELDRSREWVVRDFNYEDIGKDDAG